MLKSLTLFTLALGVAITTTGSAAVTAQGQSMSFFVSSTGSRMGGNLGRMAGADQHCQTLAPKAGHGQPHLGWVPHKAKPEVNPGERIRKRTWPNPKGTQMAPTFTTCPSKRPNSKNIPPSKKRDRPINWRGSSNR